MQIAPFSFHDLHLGISTLSEFRTKHPDPKYSGIGKKEVVCSEPQVGVTFCNYGEFFLGVSFQYVEPIFVDGKLAAIRVQPQSKGFYGGHSMREDHPSLLPALTNGFGQPKQFGNAEMAEPLFPSQFYALRWENDSSVAEYQDHWCFPGPGLNLSKEIGELLEGTYCSGATDTDIFRQPVIFYLHKELGKTLMMRVAKTTN